MLACTEIAHSLGLLRIPDNLLLRPQDAMSAPPHRVVAVVSGTQGEPMSAMSRVAVDNHKHLRLERGDVVVHSARIIPGNEKAIGRMMNHVARRGAEVVAGQMNPPVHVSGHASQEELKLLLNLVRPRYFVPIHGEYWQMSKHAALASHLGDYGLEDTFVLETGQTLVIDEEGARRGDVVGVGRVCIDSGSIDEVVEDMVIRDRRHLSEDGFLIPIIAIDKHTGRVEGLPEIVTRGFVPAEDKTELLTAARDVVVRTIESSSSEERSDWGVIQEKIRADLKRFLNRQTQRRPLVLPVILEV